MRIVIPRGRGRPKFYAKTRQLCNLREMCNKIVKQRRDIRARQYTNFNFLSRPQNPNIRRSPRHFAKNRINAAVSNRQQIFKSVKICRAHNFFRHRNFRNVNFKIFSVAVNVTNIFFQPSRAFVHFSNIKIRHENNFRRVRNDIGRFAAVKFRQFSLVNLP